MTPFKKQIAEMSKALNKGILAPEAEAIALFFAEKFDYDDLNGEQGCENSAFMIENIP